MNISETSVPGRWPRSWHKVCLTSQGATKEEQRGEVGQAWGMAAVQMSWESKYLRLRAAGLPEMLAKIAVRPYDNSTDQIVVLLDSAGCEFERQSASKGDLKGLV